MDKTGGMSKADIVQYNADYIYDSEELFDDIRFVQVVLMIRDNFEYIDQSVLDKLGEMRHHLDLCHECAVHAVSTIEANKKKAGYYAKKAEHDSDGKENSNG